MVDLSFPLSKCCPAFVNASTEAMRAFNFSELTGVLSLNESLGSSERLLEEDVGTYVPGVVYPVEIPKQMILKEVFHRLNLKIHNISLVIESADIFSAWMDVETPYVKIDGMKERKKFYGLGSHTKYGAIESVCGAVLSELAMVYGVIVKDLTYPRAKLLEDKFARELQWSGMIQDLLEKEKKKSETVKNQYEGVITEVLSVCKEFSDVLPISVSADLVHAVQPRSVRVVYNGQRPPVTRLEQLASALVTLATNAGEVAQDKEGRGGGK